MKKIIISFVLIFSIALTFQVSAAQNAKDDEFIIAAKSFFNTYKLFTENFDPDIANLYADDAVVELVGVYKDDPSKVIRITGSQMKEAIAKILPTIKDKDDIDRFYNEKYAILAGSKVKIVCTRYSELKKHEKPHEIIIEIDDEGEWKIFYEKAFF